MKGFVAIVVVVLVVALLSFAFFHFGVPGLLGGSGDGRGAGSSDASNTEAPATESVTPSASPSEGNQVCEIRIEWNDIYLDDEFCEDANDLKDKITDIGNKVEYNLIQDNATAGTYDEVMAVLEELEDVLGIVVHDG